jgi:hypothetical protein
MVFRTAEAEQSSQEAGKSMQKMASLHVSPGESWARRQALAPRAACGNL